MISAKFDNGEYLACLESVDQRTASDIATVHRGLSGWHKREQNIIMAAWRQSLADRLEARK